MYLDICLSGAQLIMFALKLTEHFDRSWWIVMLPTIIWCVLGIIITATGKNDDKGE